MRLPTLIFQASLPRLPVPSLAATLPRYLAALAPLVTPAAAGRAAADAAAFEAREGRGLQARVLASAAAARDSSYVAALQAGAYLSSDAPLPLNTSPQLTWKDDARFAADPLGRAAGLVAACVAFHLALEAGALAPDVFHSGGPAAASRSPLLARVITTLLPRALAGAPMYALGAYPLDMRQYSRLFCSTRLPGGGGAGRDALTTAGERPGGRAKAAVRHALVLVGRHAYAVDVLDGAPSASLAGARATPPRAVRARLAAARADAAARDAAWARAPGAAPPPPAVAALTAGRRGAWAASRAALAGASSANAAALRDADDALFALTLDAATPETPEALARAMLHGGGGDERWWDKSFNLVVTANGRAGLAFEHSWGDGISVLRLFDAVGGDVEAAAAAAAARGAPDGPPRPPSHAPAPGPPLLPRAALPPGVRALDFDLPPAVRAAAEGARAALDAAVAGTRLRVLRSPAVSRASVRAAGLPSADGVAQAALQAAHAAAHGGARAPSTYESASTAAFRGGRTDVVRPASAATLALSRALLLAGGAGAPAGVLPALAAAVAAHRALALAAVSGAGVDRHLAALEAAAAAGAAAGGAPLPALFASPAHAVFKDIRLSTSTLASPHLQLGGFGPVSGHSYAVGYGVDEDEGALFNVMAYTRAGAAAALGEPPGEPAPNASAGEPFSHPDVDAFADALGGALRALGGAVDAEGARRKGAAGAGAGTSGTSGVKGAGLPARA